MSSSCTERSTGPAQQRHRPGGIQRRGDYDARTWDSARFIVPLLRDAIDKAVVEYAGGTSPGRKCLDIGCGRQPFRPKIVELGYEYRGMDAEQNSEGNVDFIACIDRPLPPEVLAWLPADLALLTEVLEHVADWDSAFANLSLVLKPGGRALVTCPFIYPLHEEPFDFWRPTKHALRFFAARYGLRIVAEEQLGDFWDAVGTLVGSIDVGSFGALRCQPRANILALWRKSIRRVLLAAISSPFLRSAAPCNAAVYLSNVVVIERAPGPSTREWG